MGSPSDQFEAALSFGRALLRERLPKSRQGFDLDGDKQMTIYMVCDDNGNALTNGLQEHEAHRIAQAIADRRGESVWLSANDDPDDSGEEITPR